MHIFIYAGVITQKTFGEVNMLLNNKQILEAMIGLNGFGNEKVSPILAWKLHTIRKNLISAAENVEKFMTDIQEEYCLKDESGNKVPSLDPEGKPILNTIQIPNENIKIYSDKIKDLQEQQVELNIGTKLKLSDFPESMNISINIFSSLDPFIKQND